MAIVYVGSLPIPGHGPRHALPVLELAAIVPSGIRNIRSARDVLSVMVSNRFLLPPIGRLSLVTRRNTPSLMYLYTVHLDRITEKVKPSPLILCRAASAVSSYFRRIFSIGFPFASSSVNLSRQRISRMSGSSTSSTRTPQTTPLISPRFGLG